MKSFDQLLNKYTAENRSERLGQFFVNRYCKTNWPDLFYMADQEFAAHLIKDWLKDHNYEKELPQQIDRS
jgi:hypothetical protein